MIEFRLYILVANFINDIKLQTDTSYIIAIGAAADLASRVCLAIMSLCIQVKARYVYLAGAILMILARFGEIRIWLCRIYPILIYLIGVFFSNPVFLNVFDFYGIAILTAIMGFFRTWLHVPLPLVFAEYLSSERYKKMLNL